MMLNNRVVLITGSTRGIGQAMAIRFAKEGAGIVLNASKASQEALHALERLPHSIGQKHFFVKADIGSARDISQLMKKIHKYFGHLDILINNTGTTKFIEHSRLDMLELDLMDSIYNINFRGALLCIQKGLPLLQKSAKLGYRPQIINIASIAATTANGSNIVYCAMKAALVNLTQSLARALAPDIRVNSISPGLVETSLTREWRKYKVEQIKRTPLGQLATREDIADAALLVATGLPQMTGQNLVIDGGRILN